MRALVILVLMFMAATLALAMYQEAQAKPTLSKPSVSRSVSRPVSRPSMAPALIGGAVVGATVASVAKAAPPPACATAVPVPEGAKSFGQLICTSSGNAGCKEGWLSSKETPWNEWVQKKLKKPLAQAYSTCYDPQKKHTTVYWRE